MSGRFMVIWLHVLLLGLAAVAALSGQWAPVCSIVFVLLLFAPISIAEARDR